MQLLDFFTSFDLSLILTFAKYKAHTYMLSSPLITKSLGKNRLNRTFTIISVAVSVADKAKSDDFDL